MMPSRIADPLSDSPKKLISATAFAVLCLGLLLLDGCSVGPKYTKPTTQIPPAYKEIGSWKPAEPSDAERKGKWWEIFQDPQLNALEEHLTVSNQTLRAAQDQFLQARDELRISRSAQFPLVTANASATRQRQSTKRALLGATSPVNYSDFLLAGDVSYEADVWGRVRMVVESSRAQAQATAADLENVRLSLHAELALDYLTLRGLDAQKQLLDSNVTAFEKALDLTLSRFQGGLASREDVDLATTELEQTRAQDIDITSARDQFEHAVAVLVGQPASTFRLTGGAVAGRSADSFHRPAIGVAGEAPGHRRRGKARRSSQYANRLGPRGLLSHDHSGIGRRIRKRNIYYVADRAEHAVDCWRIRSGDRVRCRAAPRDFRSGQGRLR